MATSETPKYEHDCPDCTFLGRASGESLGYGVNEVDLYICSRPDVTGGTTCVMRVSDEGSDYRNWVVENDPFVSYAQECYRRAFALGLVEEMPETPPRPPYIPSNYSGDDFDFSFWPSGARLYIGDKLVDGE